MRKTLRFGLVLLLAMVFVTGTASAAAPTTPTDPEGVIRAIFTALNAGDVKTAVSYVADDAVLVLYPPALAAPESNVFQGKKAITDRWNFLAGSKDHMDLSNVKVDGNTVTWKVALTGDYFTGLGLDPLQAELVGIVEDGKFKGYVWNMSKESMARLAAAEALAANKEAARNWMKAWEAGDQKAMDGLLAKDFVNHTPPLPEVRADFIAAGVEGHDQFPTGKYTINNIIAEGDLVFVYGNFDGAHTGIPFNGIKASGAKANFDYMLLFRMKDGKIAERWAVSDSVMGMLVPLGYQLVPPKP
ncbi:MAG: nuclear transport factor 2 family protein [Nitrososphaerales archaeon]